jgi:hypothetical protein
MSQVCAFPRPFSFSRTITNEVEVVENGQRVKYVVRFFNLYFEGMNIRGGASVVKYVLKDCNFLKLHWVKEVKSWYVKTESDYKYMLSDGKLTADNSSDCSADYRCSLKGEILNDGFFFPDEFLEKMFRSLDEQVWEYYLKARK